MHRHRFLLAALALLACSVGPPQTEGAVPVRGNCTIPACFTLCPAGDMPFTIIIRDSSVQPIANSVVTLDFSRDPTVVLCPPSASDGYTFDPVMRIVRVMADDQGVARFALRGGRSDGFGYVFAYADGVYLYNYPVADPDQDGDLYVSTDDELVAFSKLGSFDTTVDFDCSHQVTNRDLGIFQNHIYHRCASPTPTRERTWGSLKILYR